MLSRRDVLIAGLSAVSSPLLSNLSALEPSALEVSVDTPFDHDRPDNGSFPLSCEWGFEPDTRLPTVLVVADAQQFYVRRGGARRLRTELFGDEMNVLTIVGRSRSQELDALVRPDGKTDWSVARRLLNWRQWSRDIERVLACFKPRFGQMNLYGRSGGAHLIHQLLTLRPDVAERSYVQAAVNHDLDVRWRLNPDPFWREFSADSPKEASALLDYVKSRPEQRRDLILVLQRLHFFEPPDQLPSVRLATARAFLDEDDDKVAEMRAKYQVDAINAMAGTLEGAGIVVRMAEFASPHEDPRSHTDRLHPDVEALFHHAAPLLNASGETTDQADWSQLHRQAGEVLQVAGRFDATCDYRTQIGLSGLTKNSRLLILDDDHVFQKWVASKTQPALVRAFLSSGSASKSFQQAQDAMKGLQWREA